MSCIGGSVEIVGVIPAAGHGSRLNPLVVAKETLPAGFTEETTESGGIHLKPRVVSEYVIEQMAAAGVKKIFIITRAEKCDLLKQHMDGRRYGVNIAYIIGEPQSMVHSIDLAYEWIKDSKVVMGMPDTIAQPVGGVSYLLKQHDNGTKEVSLGLYKTKNTSKFGMITIDDDNVVIKHEDKPARSDTDDMWGIAIWNPRFTQRLHEYVQKYAGKSEAVFGDVVEESMKIPNACRAFRIPDGRYYDIGTYEEYRRAIGEL